MTLDRIVVVALVNRHGAVLLRMRDERSAVRPNRWSLPGGGVEPGETPQRAAARLVHEQTGLQLEQRDLKLFWNGTISELSATGYLFTVASNATYRDIPIDPVPGAIDRYKGYVTKFISAADVLSGRSFTPVTGAVIASFMTSPQYRELAYGDRR